MQRNDSKNVFVTGAGRGIGKSIALEFAKNGYNVAINAGHNSVELESTKKEVESYGVKCVACLGDISDYEEVGKMIETIHDNLGVINILVNNAGISYVGLFQDMSKNDWDSIISTNLSSVYNTSSRVIKDMLSQGEGAIINISSVWGCVGASCEVAYSASKGGMNALTKALAKELAPSNISVNAIACGVIDTKMNAFLDNEEMQKIVEEIPFGRLGKPEEVALMVVQLAEGPKYLTGQIITVDGGWQ